MSYRVALKPAATKQLDGLPRDVQRRIIERLAGLAENPRPPGSVKLTGKDELRIRIGDYRVVYGVNDAEAEVVVVVIGHRREVYR